MRSNTLLCHNSGLLPRSSQALNLFLLYLPYWAYVSSCFLTRNASVSEVKSFCFETHWRKATHRAPCEAAVFFIWQSCKLTNLANKPTNKLTSFVKPLGRLSFRIIEQKRESIRTHEINKLLDDTRSSTFITTHHIRFMKINRRFSYRNAHHIIKCAN